MAKRKVPEDLTPEQLAEHKIKDTIANHATRSEKTAWARQYDNLSAMVDKLAPIEDRLMDLMTKKSLIVDEIVVQRMELVNSCIHPFEQLIIHDGCVVCKFCERRMAIPHDGSEEASS